MLSKVHIGRIRNEQLERERGSCYNSGEDDFLSVYMLAVIPCPS